VKALLAKVGSDDLRVIGYLLRWAFGDFLAVVEDNDFVREPQDSLHDMLDEENCHACALYCTDEVHNLAHFGGIESGNGFVEQEEVRLGGQGVSRFQPLAV